MRVSALVLFSLLAAATSARAIDIPAFEGFNANDAGWKGTSTSDSVDWHATGGVNGGAYISNSAPFTAREFFTPLRGHVGPDAALNASDGTFAGDWLAEGANKVKMNLRHNVTEPVSFFVRLAQTPNSPAIQVDLAAPIQPNVWTPVEFDVVWGNPLLTVGSETPFESFVSTIQQIAHVQIAARKPANFTSVSTFTFDVDSVLVVPEPTSAALVSLAALGCVTGLRVRRRS